MKKLLFFVLCFSAICGFNALADDDMNYRQPGIGAESDPIVGAITGIVKSDGAGNISAASAGTDYQAPLTAGVDYLAPNGSAANLTDFPTLNQNTSGYSGSLKSTATTGTMTITGPGVGTTRAKIVRDADDTFLELGGNYTPTGTWIWTSADATWPTFNQNTTGTAAFLTNLSDPNADTLLAWDDTDGAHKFLTIGSGLSYDHATHTISSTGSMTYPGAGIPISTGDAWGASLSETDGNIIYGSSGAWTKGTALPNGITATTQAAGDNSTKVATTAYSDAKVADAINDGTTAIAPSQNAVFDALAGKATEGSWTDYSATSTIAGWSSYDTKSIFVKKIGKHVFVEFDLDGTSNSTSVSFTVPYTSSTSGGRKTGCSYNKDNGNLVVGGGLIFMAAGSSTITVYKDMITTAWTNSGSKFAIGRIDFEAAS